MKKEFEKFHQFLRQEEAARLLALRLEKEEKISKAEERIAKMNQVIKSLEEKIQLIEGELDAGGDGTEFLQHYQDTMSSTWINHMMPQKLCRPLLDVAKHLGNLLYAVWEKIKHIAPYTPVTLDPRTAGQSLRVSPELNRVQITSGPLLESEKDIDEIFPVPANPERFHHTSCILTKEGFTTGEHSWDIEVGNINNWTLGVAAQSVPRRGEFEVCPEAGLWCISLQDGEYRALTSPTKILNFDNSHHLSKVHVRLDCDGGMLEFRNADTGVLIFTFTHCFAEIVYPYFESIYVGGSLAVLAQEVNISLGSDYNSLEGTAIILEDQEMKSQSPSENNIVTDSNSTIKIDVGHLIEDKEAKAICPIRENTTKPSEKVNRLNNTTAIRKHIRKTRYNVTYHVSLNRALNNINNECATMNMATINKA
ncbi:zinc-binding protein A33-like [Melanotaenia boesemani]|uniref:zinc-binding protein A33-like n=1 Tax=Melanotaenia boesemani TaxID=1250792 RepID=UPI001C04FEF4|nr:zinc-binding protein A33-like [Melanotaenia boesemani]